MRPAPDVDATPKPTLDTISFSVATHPRAATEGPDVADWRSELKQKLQKHHLRKHRDLSDTERVMKRKDLRTRRFELTPKKKPPGEASRQQIEVSKSKTVPTRIGDRESNEAEKTHAPGSQAEADRGEVVKQLFKYKLEDAGRLRERRIITFSKSKPAPPVRREPKIKRPVQTESPQPPPGSALQRQLTLEPEAAITDVRTSLRTTPPTQAQPPAVSIVELVFSRLLAGIVDSSLAVGLGFGFAWLASYLSGVVFPSVESLIVAGGCAWVLFLLNQVFFLFTLNRTPGMLWTELRLESDTGEPPEFRAILLRSLLWLPIVVTVFGLVWALFDSQGRCLHDRLTRTRIVPG